jgi:serine/threonine protein kinase
MINDSSNRDVAIFTAALQIPVAERGEYLERACGGDSGLRQRVEALLKSHERLGDFLEQSPQEALTGSRHEIPIREKAGDCIGRYKLLQKIGEGGCGVVYMAEQEEPVRRRVALKIIKPGMDTEGVIARFEAERQALALMDHPNIAKIFDAGATESGRPYFVMELIRGIKITEYCDQYSLTTDERLKLFGQICLAVQHAHQKGIIHRDIKPSNILVTITLDGSAMPVVIDFGIAKATTNQQLTDKTVFTAFEMLIGTPAYMSPEQAALSSVDVDTRTDIYSLGALLYELLTGSTPFNTDELLKVGLDEIRRVIQEQEPDRPSTRLKRMAGADLTMVAERRKNEPPMLIRTVRGDLDWIVMKALEKDRRRRYETAYGLALDVQRFLANETISARPPSNLYKFHKTFLRNKLLFASAGVIALLLVVSLILVSASLAKERESRREAEAASAKSQQVTKFLEDMLKGVGPSVARGQDTTMLHGILDQTAGRLGGELASQPEVEVELRSLIGHVYFEIGNYDRAEEMYRAALAINQELFGPESKEAAASLRDLGVALFKEGKLTEAESTYRKSLVICRRLFGEDNPDVATSLNDVATVLRHQHRLAESEALVQEALSIRRKLFGSDSLDVAETLHNLSVVLGDEGKGVESETTAREMLGIRRRVLGPENLLVADSLNDVAYAAGVNGKIHEAELLQSDALAMQRKFLGDENTQVAKTMATLGERFRQEGELKESEALLKTALSIQSKLSGENTPDFLYALDSLGATLEAEEKWPEAEVASRKALTAWRKLVGNDDPQVINTMNSLAVALEAQGKWLESETVRREVLDVWRKRAGAEDSQTLYAMRSLAATFETEGKWFDAETIHREALESWRRAAGDNDPQTFYTRRKLGLALEAEGKWPEAEKVFRDSLILSRKRAGTDDPEAVADLDRLVRVLVDQKKYDEAEELLDGALTPAFVRQSASAILLIRRVDLMGRQARWLEAETDAALVIQYQPANHYRYHTMAGLLIETHDLQAYEKLCQKILTLFANTSNPYVAERTVEDCLLLPYSRTDLRLMDQLADTAIRAGSNTVDMPYFEVCKAMSDYRLGHFPEAIDWAEQAVKSSVVNAQAKAYAILTMAHWQLGQKDAARAMLAKGNILAPSILPESNTVDLGELWLAWLFARVSLDEAATLIQHGPKSEPQPNQP